MSETKLFIYSTMLITVGVLMSYSLSTYPTILYHYDALHFFSREFGTAVIGVLLMWVLSYVDMDKVFSPIGIFFAAFFGLMMLVIAFLPENIAPSIGGAKRWIKIPLFPLALAPVEFFKIGFIWLLAWSFARKYDSGSKRDILNELCNLLPHLFVFVICFILIAFMQNDLGQAVLLALIMATLILLSGGSFRIICMALFLGVCIAIVSIIYRPHRLNRIKSWWSGIQDLILSAIPDKLANYLRMDNIPEPYQVLNATHAIQNGGFSGQGIGNGVVKLGFLSDVHTDMVLAGLTEETGLVGLGLCMFVFFLVLLRIFKIANRMERGAHFLFCMGVGVMLGFSLIINALGVSGIIPLKGIAVPFLTYGGSSLLANCIAIGLVLALSKKTKRLY